MQNKLLALLKANAGERSPDRFSVSNAGDLTKIYITDVIDSSFGVSAADVVAALAGAGDVHLHINSPGGDVFEATAMASAIAAHAGKVTAHIDGVAASAATRVALAAGEVRMTDSAMFMIHDSWTFALGNKNELRDTAALLEKVDSTISADYARKTGKTAEEIAALMAAETWFTAQEALDAGFVDAIDTSTQAKAKKWNLSAYDRAPQEEEKPDNSIAEQRARNLRRLRLLEIT
jgi:ATP-dependent Clp protease protease subunit